MRPPSQPVDRGSALAWARAESATPADVRAFRHTGFDADEVSGGWAFVDTERLYVVGRDGTFGTSVLRHREPALTLDGWLERRRHANRPLSPDDLGPWQEVAARAVEAGVTVAEVGDPRIATHDDCDHADWIWMSLRRSRVGPLRTLASSDHLMGPPRPPGREGPRTHACPLCGRPAPHQDRYPRAVCDDCHATTVDADGRPVHGRNLSFNGGFEARFSEPLPGAAPYVEGDGGPCDAVTRTGTCWVAGHECSIGEARFGGVVVEAR